MAKRKVDEILNDTLPDASKLIYNKKWEEFKTFCGEKSKPDEADMLQYFDHLHTEKKLKASTIWSPYSMINAIYQREYGERLQNYPRVTQLLKSYNATYERKVASVFEKKEIDEYLNLPENTPFILLRKAIIAISLCGGLRTAELRDLQFENVVKKQDVYEVTLIRKKQNGEKKKSTFVIPSSLSFHVTNYFVALEAVIGVPTGPLLKGTPTCKSTKTSKFVNQPMGRNLLYCVGKDVATKLGLDNPETYTGHCFRRTSATMAADGGATPQQMQRAFGWKSVSTAQKYVEESSSGALAMASIITKTLTTQTSDNITTVGNKDGEGSSTKTYNIHDAGENNTYYFY